MRRLLDWLRGRSPAPAPAAAVSQGTTGNQAPTIANARDVTVSYVTVEASSFQRENRRVPRQLPDRPVGGQLFGREREVAELIALLRRSRDSAVVGPAGLGKTAIAGEAVRTIVGEDDAGLAASEFPDGVVLIDLYRLKGGTAAAWSALADAFIGNEHADLPARERAAKACLNRRALIIVEGAEEAGRGVHAPWTELLDVVDPASHRLILTRDSSQVAAATAVRLKEALDVEPAGALFDATFRGEIAPELRASILELLQGHPLALTWAASLLSRGDESPKRLIAEWRQSSLPNLANPIDNHQTLRWLFERSARVLNQDERRLLDAAGLLAHADIPWSALSSTLDDPDAARSVLKRLVQSGLMRLSSTREDHWHFTHVLGYQFARKETGNELQLRVQLGDWARQDLETALASGASGPSSALLLHVSALLRTDEDQSLWPLVRSCLYRVIDRVTAVGQLERVFQLLSALSDWFNRQSQQIMDEPGWRRERCALLDHIGDACMSRGDGAGALDAYRRGLSIREALTALDPANADWQRGVAIGYNKVGAVLFAQGDGLGAVAAYDKSLKIVEALVARDPANTLWQRDLSVGHNKMGDALRAQGDGAGALNANRKALRIIETLFALDPANTELQRDLSITQNKVGDVLGAHGDGSGALDAYRTSLKIAENLAVLDPSNTQWQRDLSISHGRMGDALAAQGDGPGALAAYGKELKIAEDLAKLDAANTVWQQDLSISYKKLGDVLLAQGDGAGAIGAHRKALKIAEVLAALDPANAAWQRELLVSHGKVGDVLNAQGDGEGALDAYRQSLQIIESLVRLNPANVLWQRDLSIAHNKIANLLTAQGDRAGALVSYRKDLEIAETLAALDPANALWQRDLSISHNKIGDVLLADGKAAEALVSYASGLAIAKTLAALDTANADWQRDLSISHNKIGDARIAQGESAEAFDAYDKALKVVEMLVQIDPANTEWRRDLSISHNKLGDVQRAQGDDIGALTAHRRSLEVIEALAMLDPSNALWQRDVAFTCARLSRIEQGQTSELRRMYLARGREIMLQLRSSGRLLPSQDWTQWFDDELSKLS